MLLLCPAKPSEFDIAYFISDLIGLLGTIFKLHSSSGTLYPIVGGTTFS